MAVVDRVELHASRITTRFNFLYPQANNKAPAAPTPAASVGVANPPFGFALFYLRGVTPPSVTTADMYRGVVPFILLQVLRLGLWLI